MVFSPELGYDPEEWEECPESEHFLAFGFFTRIWLTLAAIGFASGFFWLLEARKEWGKLAKDEPVENEAVSQIPPPKPERRMSLEARLVAEQMRNEAALQRASAQRDVNASRSIERIRRGSDEARQMPPFPPPSHNFEVPPNAFDNVQDLHALNLTSLQNAPPCVTPSDVSYDRASLDEQYAVLAKNLEKQLLAEIEHFGLLIGRHGDTSAPKKVAEALQERHRSNIDDAVNALVQREAGGSAEIAAQYKKQLENKIEDAVWQYNHKLLQNDNAGVKLYETSLTNPEEGDVWVQQQQKLQEHELERQHHHQHEREHQQQHSPKQALSDPWQQKQQPDRTSGEFTQQQVKSFFESSPSEPQSPTTPQKKGSSSSEEGFIKVYPDQAAAEHGSQRPPSTGAGSCITADDIEFMPTEATLQAQAALEAKKHLKPQEIDEIKRLLQEYDLNSLRDEVPPPLTTTTQQTAPPRSSKTPESVEYDYYGAQPKTPRQSLQQPQQQIYRAPEPVQPVIPPGDDYPYGKPADDYQQYPQQSKRPPQLDIPAPNAQQSPQVSSPVSPHSLGFEVVDSPPAEDRVRATSKSPKTAFNAGDNVAQFLYSGPTDAANAQISSNITIGAQPTIPDEDPRRLAEADIYLQDAIEYVEATAPEGQHQQQQKPILQRQPLSSGSGGGFVIEEDMLESSGRHKAVPAPNLSDLEKQLRPPSGISQDRTSRLVKTNEIFSKPEPSFDDADDAITSAPEIQSIEIPPDQMSESSNYNIDNLSEHHDFLPGSSGAPSPPRSPKKNRAPPQFLDTSRQGNRSSRRGAPEAPKMWRVSPTPDDQSVSVSISERGGHPWKMRKQSSLLSVLNVTSMQEMLLTLTSLDGLAMALRKAGLESTNLIFGIDYTASNKYQGELSFNGLSLHHVDPTKRLENPYQQVIRIMGNSLAPFATSGVVPVYGFGDATTGDWSVFKLKDEGQCRDLDEVLNVYTQVTPNIGLSGPTNFAPLIYEAIRICQRVMDYHILVIIADGQVTNERATRKAIVHACHYPLSIIVVGVGDGPWDMMRVFDESLPKRPWDNFHFVEFHEIMKAAKETSGEARELAFAVQSLLEVPDQFATVRRLGLLGPQSKAE
uniref:VWFA domain-containing protein n=1 Tax=Panagrellus redivivus TaxID=6233 RepID=A0A7E4ZQ28_PANRE